MDKIKVIEQTITGKKSQAECEDGLVVNDRFVAVIDGSTSKTETKLNGNISNGRYCMELIKRYIDGMSADIGMETFCAGVTEYVREACISEGADMQRLQLNPAERATASAIVYSVKRKQIWMVGDCQCIADGEYHDNGKPDESRLAAERSKFLKHALSNGAIVENIQTDDCGRKHIQEELKKSCNGQNVTYAVIDGFEIPLDKVKVIDVRQPDKGIILASDGYPFLKNTLEGSETALTGQLTDDPLCIGTFKATKGLMKGNNSFDDRCYIKFIAI